MGREVKATREVMEGRSAGLAVQRVTLPTLSLRVRDIWLEGLPAVARQPSLPFVYVQILFSPIDLLPSRVKYRESGFSPSTLLRAHFSHTATVSYSLPRTIHPTTGSLLMTVTMIQRRINTSRSLDVESTGLTEENTIVKKIIINGMIIKKNSFYGTGMKFQCTAVWGNVARTQLGIYWFKCSVSLCLTPKVFERVCAVSVQRN